MTKGKVQDLIGQKFGRLTVIKRAENNAQGSAQWLCECDCDGKEIIILGGRLKSGNTKSCGCLNKEMASKRLKKYNTYDLTGKYGIGYTSKGEEFYFDLEDYDKIKDYCWYKDKYGYLMTHYNNKNIFMHRFVMNCLNRMDIEVDHKFHNIIDNRKESLRVASKSQNGMNKYTFNPSGFIGISFNKNNKWVAKITYNKKQIYLGSFIDIDDAIIARLEAEQKYFGEFAPQQHLYKQYGILQTSN